MSQPVPSDSDQQAEQRPAAEPESAADAPEAQPLNRAERRAAAAKAAKGEPTHVGPRGDLSRQVRGARPHSKRPRG